MDSGPEVSAIKAAPLGPGRATRHLIVPFGEGQQRAGLARASSDTDLHLTAPTQSGSYQASGWRSWAGRSSSELFLAVLGPGGTGEMTQIIHGPALSLSSLMASYMQEFKKKEIHK